MEAAGVPSPGPSFRVLVRDSTLETGRCFVTRDGLSRAFGINNVPSMGCDPVEATLLDADDGSSVSVNLVAWTAGHCRVEGLRPWLHRRGVCIGQKLQVERSADGKTVLRVLPGTAVATAAAAGPAAGPSDAHRTAGGGGGPAPCGAPSAAAATAGEDIAPVAADRTAAPPLQQQQQQCSGRARLGQGIAEQARQRKRICREPEQQQQRQQGQPKASDQGTTQQWGLQRRRASSCSRSSELRSTAWQRTVGWKGPGTKALPPSSGYVLSTTPTNHTVLVYTTCALGTEGAKDNRMLRLCARARGAQCSASSAETWRPVPFSL